MEEQVRFGLTEEEQMLQDMVRRLAKEKVAPGAEERDQKGEYPWDMLELMRENGLMGIDFPEAYGGMAAGMIAHCVAVEELAKADAGVALIPSCQELGSLPIILGGNHEQKEKFLTPLSSGEKLAAFGLTEARGGSDVAALRTRAVRKGDKYILNGTKMFITNGGVADIITVYAVTDPDGPPHKSASVFVLEKGTPGFSVGKPEHKLGIRCSDTRELVFEDVEIPVENRLGEEGDGFHIMMKTLDFSRPSVAAQALGIAAGAFEYATEYAKERVSFGKPIIKHQAIGFKLADMSMRITAARQLLWKTCSLLDSVGKDLSKVPTETIRHSSMSKAYCADVAMWTTVEAVQVLGGYGYISEYPVERMMRDAKITQIYEGTNEIQRIVIASTLQHPACAQKTGLFALTEGIVRSPLFLSERGYSHSVTRNISMAFKRNRGRKADELRPWKISRDVLVHAEGSALIEAGQTQVLCAATVEDKVPSFLKNQGKGWVTAEYSMLPRSTHTRSQRERGRVGGRTMEIQRLIGRSLRAVTDLTGFGERTVTVDCDVIQADGGTRVASITGAWVALDDAFNKLVQEGAISRNPLIDCVAAVSVGIVEKTVLLDLDYDEDSAAEVDMNVVMTGSKRLVEVQATAEQTPFSLARMNALVRLAQNGIEFIQTLQKAEPDE